MTALSAATDIGTTFATVAFFGSLLLAVPVALVAGVISFASPYVLQLSRATSDASEVWAASPRRDLSTSPPSKHGVWRPRHSITFNSPRAFELCPHAHGRCPLHRPVHDRLRRARDSGWSPRAVHGSMAGHGDSCARVVVSSWICLLSGSSPSSREDPQPQANRTAGLCCDLLLGLVFGLGWAPGLARPWRQSWHCRSTVARRLGALP